METSFVCRRTAKQSRSFLKFSLLSVHWCTKRIEFKLGLFCYRVWSVISNAAKYAVVINVESCLRTVQVRRLFLLIRHNPWLIFKGMPKTRVSNFMACETCDFAVLIAVKGNIENQYLKKFETNLLHYIWIYSSPVRDG